MTSNLPNNKKLIKGTFFYSIRQVLVTLIQLITSVLILKWIDPINFGNYSIIALVLGLTQIIAEGGFGVYLIQRQEEINNNDLSEIVSFQLSIYFIIHLLLALLYFFLLKNGVRQEIYLYVLVTFFVLPFTILRSSNYVWLEKNLDFDKIAIIEIVEIVVYSLTTIILAFNKFGVWSFIIGSLTKAFIGYLLIKRYKKWIFTFIRPRITSNIKKALEFGISYHTPTLINYVRISANPIIIGPLLGMAAVGIADRAIFFAALPLYFIGAVQQKVLFPYFSSIQSSNEKVKNNFETIYYLSSILDKIFYIPLIIFAPFIIKNYYPVWETAIPLFYIALIGNILFGSLSFSTYPVLNGLGKTKIIAITSVISVILSWVLLFPLIYFFGLKGYAILGLLIWIIGLIPGYILIKKHIYNVIIFKQFFIPAFSFSIAYIISLLLFKYFYVSLFSISIVSIISIIFYLILIYLFDNKIIKSLSTKFLKPFLNK
jgi:O-antigen/teichoic acid export membrane protein